MINSYLRILSKALLTVLMLSFHNGVRFQSK